MSQSPPDNPDPSVAACISRLYSGNMTVHLYGPGGNGGAGGGGGVSGAGYPAGAGGGGGAWVSSAPVQVMPGHVYRFSTGGTGGNGGSVSRYQPAPVRGMDGFDGADLAVGTVRGYRWWSLKQPDLSLDPLTADEHWPAEPMRGVRSIAWEPGENTARCLNPGAHNPGMVPLLECGCGFWAYWDVQPSRAEGTVQVLGVIEGYGNVLTGPAGFRCSQARLLALCLGSRVQAVMQAASYTSLLQKHLPRSKVYDFGDPGSLCYPAGDGTPEYIAARDRAEAWTAVISDRLGQLYPEAALFETEKLLRAQFPPGENMSCAP